MVRPPTAAVRAKARQIIADGGVLFIALGPHGCAARVQGDHGEYDVTLTEQEFTCTCELGEYRPASACSHITAAWLEWRRFHPKEAQET